MKTVLVITTLALIFAGVAVQSIGDAIDKASAKRAASVAEVLR